jgi:hypothetical protein
LVSKKNQTSFRIYSVAFEGILRSIRKKREKENNLKKELTQLRLPAKKKTQLVHDAPSNWRSLQTYLRWLDNVQPFFVLAKFSGEQSLEVALDVSLH